MQLDINYDKTKILIFGIRSDDRFHFKMGKDEISICKEFKYFGVVFTKSRRFCKARNIFMIKKICASYI